MAVPIAYLDSDSDASDVFESAHPWVATHTCTARCALSGAGDVGSFVSVAEHARVAFMGVPCRNLIPMNQHRDEKGDDARQCLTAVDLVDITRPEAVIIEAPASLFVADNAKLFQQFTSKVDAINYVMHIITMEASKYGSLQARPRLYPVLIRRDIHESRRPFCGPSPSMISQRTLRDVVLPADHPDLPALRSTQNWIRIRDGASHLASYKGPRCASGRLRGCWPCGFPQSIRRRRPN